MVKLNFHGASKGNIGLAGAGYSLKKNMGGFVLGGLKYLGVETNKVE